MFIAKKQRVYLDWAASAPTTKSAARAFTQALCFFGNPSSPHKEGHDARTVLENARRTIAHIVEAKPDDVVFTSGATEANAIALRGHVQALLALGRAAKDIHILYSPTSHSSIVKTAQALALEGVLCEALPITSAGQVDVESFVKMLREETALVSLDAVCGETGGVENTHALRSIIEKTKGKYGRPLLHVDASQAAFTQKLTRSHWGADLLVLDAQKLGGVRGVGALIARRTIPLAPLFEGGGQERGIRPGTEMVALACAFASALSHVALGREAFRERAQRARTSLIATAQSITDCVINQSKDTVPHILNLSLLGRDTDYLVALLNEKGFAVSSRSACETETSGSRVVLALTGDAQRAASTLRVSWGPTTNARAITQFGHALIASVTFLDAHSK